MSVTPPEKRVKRYEAKMDADVIAATVDAQRDLMIEKASVKFAEIADIQDFAKAVLAKYGIPSEFTLIATKTIARVYGIAKRFYGDQAKVEATHYLNYQYCKLRQVFAQSVPLDKIFRELAGYLGIDWSAPTVCYS